MKPMKLSRKTYKAMGPGQATAHGPCVLISSTRARPKPRAMCEGPGPGPGHGRVAGWPGPGPHHRHDSQAMPAEVRYTGLGPCQKKRAPVSTVERYMFTCSSLPDPIRASNACNGQPIRCVSWIQFAPLPGTGWQAGSVLISQQLFSLEVHTGITDITAIIPRAH